MPSACRSLLAPQLYIDDETHFVGHPLQDDLAAEVNAETFRSELDVVKNELKVLMASSGMPLAIWVRPSSRAAAGSWGAMP